MKIGAELRIVGEVRQDGVLVDISTWTIRADARRETETGTVLGSFTVTKPSLGTYVLVLDTSAIAAGRLAIDTRLIPPGGATLITDTLSVALNTPVTA